MALGTAAVGVGVGQEGSNVNMNLITFLGDSAYAAGGTADFQAFVQAAVGRGNLEVMAVIAQDCGLHSPVYDKANDKLKVLLGSTGVEVGNGDNSAITYNVLVLSK